MGIRGYIDNQLTNDEEILYRAHISWVPLILHMFPYMLVSSIIGGIVWTFTSIGFGLLVIPLGFVIGLVGQSKRIIHNLGVDIVVTNKRLHCKTGLITIENDRESSLSRIDDTDIDIQSFLQRGFQYGSIAIRTLSGGGSNNEDFFSFKEVSKPQALKQAINTAKDAYAAWGEQPGRAPAPRARTEREVEENAANRRSPRRKQRR